MGNLSKYVRNISGDEQTNLVLGWHGGATEEICKIIGTRESGIGSSCSYVLQEKLISELWEKLMLAILVPEFISRNIQVMVTFMHKRKLGKVTKQHSAKNH